MVQKPICSLVLASSNVRINGSYNIVGLVDVASEIVEGIRWYCKEYCVNGFLSKILCGGTSMLLKQVLLIMVRSAGKTLALLLAVSSKYSHRSENNNISATNAPIGRTEVRLFSNNFYPYKTITNPL